MVRFTHRTSRPVSLPILRSSLWHCFSILIPGAVLQENKVHPSAKKTKSAGYSRSRLSTCFAPAFLSVRSLTLWSSDPAHETTHGSKELSRTNYSRWKRAIRALSRWGFTDPSYCFHIKRFLLVAGLWFRKKQSCGFETRCPRYTPVCSNISNLSGDL